MAPQSAWFRALAFSFLLAKATAHIVMANPVPFSAEYMATSPLDSSGSNFPCQYKDSSSYNFVTMNNLSVGSDIPLTFNGSASHGGGTCQLAVTMDIAPTKTSVWKNIMVFEGGCPTKGDGNDGTDKYTFQIPAKFPNGRATLGWVWNNLIGNREIYMSCAPITVSGGSDDKSYYDTLPDLYVVNMPPSSCSIAEGKNLIIPNPGAFVSSLTGSASFASATGPSCPAATGESSNATGSSGAISATSGANASPSGGSGAASSYVASGNASGYGPTSTAVGVGSSATGGTAGVYSTPTNVGSGTVAVDSSASVVMSTGSSAASHATSAPDAIVPTTTGAAVMPTANTATADSSATTLTGAAPASSATSSVTNNGTLSSNGASACSNTNDGALVCNGPAQFGLCNQGGVVWQDVAAGTTCENGQVAKRQVVWQHPRWFGKRHP